MLIDVWIVKPTLHSWVKPSLSLNVCVCVCVCVCIVFDLLTFCLEYLHLCSYRKIYMFCGPENSLGKCTWTGRMFCQCQLSQVGWYFCSNLLYFCWFPSICLTTSEKKFLVSPALGVLSFSVLEPCYWGDALQDCLIHSCITAQSPACSGNILCFEIVLVWYWSLHHSFSWQTLAYLFPSFLFLPSGDTSSGCEENRL